MESCQLQVHWRSCYIAYDSCNQTYDRDQRLFQHQIISVQKTKIIKKKNGDPEKNPNYKYFGFEPEVWHPWWYITSW